jgi:SAM-dependent methyltransferase
MYSPDPLMPPPEVRYTARAPSGPGVFERNFRSIGEEFLGYCIKLAHLEPADAVLDVGCGLGQLAVPLTGFLGPDGRYDGIDIVPRGIRWCRETITARHPRFRFHLADLYNRNYHPEGRSAAATYVFPFDAGTFDFIYLRSVFTHMKPPEIVHYFTEIARLLRTGGRCLTTYFLLNAELTRLNEALRIRELVPECGYFRTTGPEGRDTFSHEEAWVRGLHDVNGLRVVEPVRYDSWCGRADGMSSQDVVFATKDATTR